MDYSLWVFIHIMLLVYWLGADLGVLLLALGAKNAAYSFEQRAVMMKYSMLIDFTPRLASALMFPVGLHMSATLGLITVAPFWFVIAWTICFLWMGVIVGQVKLEGQPIAQTLRRINLTWQGLFFLFLMALGVMSWGNGAPLGADWLALKIILFALIFACSIAIDVLFAPVGPAFMRLATEGSTPEIEQAIQKGINTVTIPVILIYVLLAVIAYIGIAKPY